MNSLSASLTSLGQSLLAWLGPTLVWTALLLTGAWLVDGALARRVRASYRMWLYLPVALRLVLPMRWESPVGVGLGRAALLLEGATVEATGARASLLPLVVGIAYLLMTSALLTAWYVARRRLDRALASAIPARPELAALDRNYVLCEHAALGPLAIGVLQPRIILPSPIVDALDASALRCVLAHEKAHLSRGDQLTAPLLSLLSIAAWPVAPVWLAVRRVRQLMELACDQAAVADGNSRRRYGETLLALADWTPIDVPGSTQALHFRSQLGARLKALRSSRRWPAAVQLSAVALGGVLLVACAASHPSRSSGLAEGPPATATGNLDKEIIRRVIQHNLPSVKACYERTLLTQPNLELRAVMDFTIASSGRVIAASSKDQEPTHQAVIGCISQSILTWEFPQPEGGGNVVVSYPFIMKNDDPK